MSRASLCDKLRRQFSCVKTDPTGNDLAGWADSYERGQVLIELVLAADPQWPETLGEWWSVCDHYPPAMKSVLQMLHDTPAIRSHTMSDAEREALAALPEMVTVYRGCYASNRRGFSWTTDRAVAERFPFLYRYRRTDDGPPLLLEGVVKRASVLFVKLDRKECEVVTLPRCVRVTQTHVIEMDAGMAA